MTSRRAFIQGLIIVLFAPKSIADTKNTKNTKNTKKFLSSNTFKIPSLELGNRKGKDVYFDLKLKQGFSQILPNLKTKTWGINQSFLGVTLRAKKGDKVHIKVANKLEKTTTLHWHGMKLPAKADGGPHQPIEPNETWLSEFKIIQPAASTWYHSHQLHKTGEHVYKGLAGMFIIDDDTASSLNLPSEYGVDDFPVIIQDREFNKDGSFSYSLSMHDKRMGKFGSFILVNGTIKPVLNITKPLIRLRILNGSNARIYNLAFDDNRPFYVIASDGGLLEKTIQENSIKLAPAERIEVLVDVSDGKMPILRHQENVSSNRSRGILSRIIGSIRELGNANRGFDIFQINATAVEKTKVSIPKLLVTHPKLNEQIDRKRSFDLQIQRVFAAINGKPMDINRIDETVKAGSTEIWTVRSTNMMSHPFHIHNAQFKIISKRNIREYEKGFKDTVLVEANSSVQVLVQFPNYSDDKFPYMYHCHILEHEDSGMMGQFLVV